jgi:hypothetical protein
MLSPSSFKFRSFIDTQDDAKCQNPKDGETDTTADLVLTEGTGSKSFPRTGRPEGKGVTVLIRRRNP